MYILHIDTTTKVCSVAVAKNGKQIALVEINSEKLSHSEKLHLFIEQAVQESKISLQDLSAVAVSKGPGSYTGLRIGVSAAKGLCFGLDLPLISVDTLEAMAHFQAKSKSEKAVFIPMIDARRMEVFAGVYQNNTCLEKVHAHVLETNSFEKYANEEVYFFGDGAEKAIETLPNNFNFIPNIGTSSQNLIQLAWEKFEAKAFEDVAYFEPYYLKDFVAGKPKKML